MPRFLERFIPPRFRISQKEEPVAEKEPSEECAPATYYEAVDAGTGKVIATRILWAGTSEERRRGLLGRSSLGREEGIYIVPTQWIHMFGMRFPIDVAFLAADGLVLHIHHSLKPNRLSRPVLRAEGALELAAGTLRAAGISVGDTIELHSAIDKP